MRDNRPGTAAKLILAFLMSASISQSFYSSLFMTQKLSNTIFLAVVPMTLILYIMFKNKITSIVSSVLIVVGLSILLFNIFRGTSGSYKIFDYFDWLTLLVNDEWRPESGFYSILTELILLFLVSLLVFLFTVKFFNFYLMAFIGLAIFFVQLQFNFFSSTQAYIMFIFSLMLYYFFSVLNRRKKVYSYDVGNKLKYLVFIAPVCIIVMLISIFLPIKGDRISWSWLDLKADTTVNSVVSFFEERFSDKDLGVLDYFSVGSAGFGKSDRLGGNISLDDTHVLNVKSKYPNLYLKGSSKAFYDGHHWYDEHIQYSPASSEKLSQYSIMVDILNIITDETNIFSDAQAEVEFVDLKTKSLFVPNRYNLLNFNNPIDLFIDSEQLLSAKDLIDSGFSYKISYDNLELSSDEFQTLIRKSHKGYLNVANIEEFWGKQVKKYNLNLPLPKKEVRNGKTFYSGDFTLVDSLINNNRMIYKRYTNLPATITARVRQLAADITRDKESNYDKAKAIETYLSQNYPYNLRPGTPPENQDFVDYFLFDRKEGYCTYYASAMTIMLRCIDIPARFVEGYILPPSAGENGIYEVTNQQAHAWVEVYFEGFGWIPFEPTSPFVANMYGNRDISANISSDMQNKDYDDYMDMINKYRNEETKPDLLPESTNDGSAAKTKSNISRMSLTFIFLSIILIAFAGFALSRRIKHKQFIKKISYSTPNHAVLMAYSYILNLLSLHKITIKAGETPSQFAERVEKAIDLKDFENATGYFITARYSLDSLSKKERQEMLHFVDKLLQYTDKNLNKFKLFVYKFISGTL